ncbi:MAG: hypothetical protein AAGK21_11670, partial [Bacteroidota bacterium]
AGVAASQRSNILITGVFSASDQLAARKELHRVVDAIDAGDDVATFDTFLGDAPTDIHEDFDATDTCVTVPRGAHFLFLSAFDDNFNDNVDLRPGGQAFGLLLKK